MELNLRPFAPVLFLFSFLIFSSKYFCQSEISPADTISFLEINSPEYLRARYNLNFTSATIHLPVFLINPLDNWFSPKQKMFINGISFEQYPFNFSSMNLIPFDILNVNNFENNEAGVYELQSSPLGGISLYSTSKDSFEIKMRGYFGSETDDPLIHFFTKDTIQHQNKNKIPPSGSLAISNRTERLKYRFTGGYFGNFSTGSINNAVFQKSPYFVNKQNKQLFASAELDYEKDISFYSSLKSYYGWDIPPFISAYVHFETYIYTIRTTVRNLFDGFSVSVINDGFFAEVHKTIGILPAKFHSAKYSFLPKWEKKKDKLSLTLSSDINLHTASDLLDNNKGQIFFNEDYLKLSYGINFLTGYRLSEKIFLNFISRFDKHFSEDLTLSASSKINYRVSDDLILLSLSSVNAFPNLTDLYGNFFITEEMNSIRDNFKIAGNKELKKERVNYAGLEYRRNFSENFSGDVKVFFQNVENPIGQKTISSVITQPSGEIIREANYLNGISKKASGTNIRFQYYNKFLQDFFIDYIFTENREVIYFPKHLITSKIEIKLPVNSILGFLFYYKSKTTWEEFAVPAENDFRNNTGYDGTLPEVFSFDFSYRLHLNNFYFYKSLYLNITFQNILNKNIRYIPGGNFMERTILFSLYGIIR